MADNVRCLIHGDMKVTYVCCHIVNSLETGQAVGFHWPEESTLRRSDAWCSTCEQVRLAEGGDWTNAAMAVVQMKTLCGGCYDQAKNMWLEARQADAVTRN